MEASFTLCLVALFSTSTEAQSIPASYTYSTTDIVSMNGSSVTGHCSSVTINCGGTTTCVAPSASVLFDGNTPTLTGLDGDMWASQLLTLQPTRGMAAEITFNFSNNPNFRVERLEVVMFNCPQRGIAVQNIRLFDTNSEIGIITPTITSCDSLVRVCILAPTFIPSLSLQFYTHHLSEWVHLAELRFWGNSATCPPDAVITTLTPVTLATTTGGSSQTSTATIKPSTSAESVPTTASFNTTFIQCEVCASCSTSATLASVITAILTALLTTAVFVIVQIAVCKYRTPEEAETGTSAGGEGQVYEQMDGGEGGVAVSDPTYTEVGTGGGRGTNVLELKENEAYQETTIAVKENEAYGTHR